MALTNSGIVLVARHVRPQAVHPPPVWWWACARWGQCRPSRRSAFSPRACSPCKWTLCCSAQKCSACATGDQRGCGGHGSWKCSGGCSSAGPGRRTPPSFCHRRPQWTTAETRWKHRLLYVIIIFSNNTVTHVYSLNHRRVFSPFKHIHSCYGSADQSLRYTCICRASSRAKVPQGEPSDEETAAAPPYVELFKFFSMSENAKIWEASNNMYILKQTNCSFCIFVNVLGFNVFLLPLLLWLSQ